MRLLALLALATLAVAGPDDEHRMRPDHAPTPYTAAQVRAGCPDGRVSIYRIEAAGAPPVRQRLGFARGDENGIDVEAVKTDADGKLDGPPFVGRSTWKELQAHASFPAAQTKITEETVKTPAGEFACMLYTVEADGMTRRFWFAKDLPGPPVKMVTASGGADVMTMVLVENRPFGFARCFGPQDVAAADGAPDARITLEVAKGTDVAAAPGTTMLAGEVTRGVLRRPAPDELYVVVRSTSRVAGAVRVTKGPLKGAVIHLRGETAVYPLPRGVNIPTGTLEFEIVALKKAE